MVSPALNARGQYGEGAKSSGKGAIGIFLLLGLTVGVYALSPGARYFYKHGQLPPNR